ncbi:GNAT family acetyltransferase [Stella sp.]|uniref:GNAT family acetyltransferase n=1 Tax=Stella sp. TaxID=2912054 RepID=UPI0035B1D764
MTDAIADESAPPAPSVRPITDADVPAVVALWHAAGVTRPWNDPLHDIAMARRSPHATVLVALVDGVVAATAMVGEDGHRGWVYYVAADPGRRGLGLGRAVMAAAERWLVDRGVAKLNLLVRGDNRAAVGFYAALGYRDTGSVCLQKVLVPPAG